MKETNGSGIVCAGDRVFENRGTEKSKGEDSDDVIRTDAAGRWKRNL